MIVEKQLPIEAQKKQLLKKFFVLFTILFIGSTLLLIAIMTFILRQQSKETVTCIQQKRRYQRTTNKHFHNKDPRSNDRRSNDPRSNKQQSRSSSKETHESSTLSNEKKTIGTCFEECEEKTYIVSTRLSDAFCEKKFKEFFEKKFFEKEFFEKKKEKEEKESKKKDTVPMKKQSQKRVTKKIAKPPLEKTIPPLKKKETPPHNAPVILHKKTEKSLQSKNEKKEIIEKDHPTTTPSTIHLPQPVITPSPNDRINDKDNRQETPYDIPSEENHNENLDENRGEHAAENAAGISEGSLEGGPEEILEGSHEITSEEIPIPSQEKDFSKDFSEESYDQMVKELGERCLLIAQRFPAETVTCRVTILYEGEKKSITIEAQDGRKRISRAYQAYLKKELNDMTIPFLLQEKRIVLVF